MFCSLKKIQRRPAKAQVLLDKLYRDNLFLVALDDKRIWHRYHHLFAELLRARLEHQHPELKKDLHRKAAEWMEQNGLLVEAVDHALLGSDHNRAARLVEEHSTGLLAKGELHALMGWIDSLPPQVRRSRPRLCIHQAYALAFAGKLQAVSELLGHAEEAVRTSGLTTEQARPYAGSITAIRAMAAVMAGLDESGLAFGNQASDLLSAEQKWDLASAAWARGYALRSLGRLTEAASEFELMIRYGREMENPWTLVSGLMDLALVARTLGQLNRARLLFEEALHSAELAGKASLGYLARMEAGLAGILYEQDQLSQAKVMIDRAAGHVDQWPNPNHLVYTLAIQSRIRLADGDYAAAFSTIEQAYVAGQTQTLVRITRRLVETGFIRLWLRANQAQSPLPETDRTDYRVSVILDAWKTELDGLAGGSLDEAAMAASIMLSRVLLAQREPNESICRMKPVIHQAQKIGNAPAALEAMLLTALGYDTMDAKHETEAFLALEKAFVLGQAGGFVRTFLDEGPALQRLIIRWLKKTGQHAVRGYALNLSEKFDSTFEHHPAIADFAETLPKRTGLLSEREMEILSLIADGLTNEEIARRLIISLGTVKAHTAAIFRKLDVSNRTQAVAYGRELRFLK